MKRIILFTFFALSVVAVTAQSSSQVKWAYSAKKISDKTYEIHMTATLGGNWHIYSQNVGVEGPIPTKFTFTKNPLLVPDTKVNEIGKLISKEEEVWGGKVRYYEKTVDFVTKVKVKGNTKTKLAGKVEFMVCDDEKCLPPSEVDFVVNIGG